MGSVRPQDLAGRGMVFFFSLLACQFEKLPPRDGPSDLSTTDLCNYGMDGVVVKAKGFSSVAWLPWLGKTGA